MDLTQISWISQAIRTQWNSLANTILNVVGELLSQLVFPIISSRRSFELVDCLVFNCCHFCKYVILLLVIQYFNCQCRYNSIYQKQFSSIRVFLTQNLLQGQTQRFVRNQFNHQSLFSSIARLLRACIYRYIFVVNFSCNRPEQNQYLPLPSLVKYLLANAQARPFIQQSIV